jgi:hypothetical protein
VSSCLSEFDESDPLAHCMLGFFSVFIYSSSSCLKSACVSNMHVTTRTLTVYAKETASSL